MLEQLEGKGEEGGKIGIKEKWVIYINHTDTPQSNNLRMKNKRGGCSWSSTYKQGYKGSVF